MSDTVVFLDANVLASPVTRTLVVAGGRVDRLLLTWSAHVEAEADRHARGTSSSTNVTARFVDVYGTTPVPPDPDQPSVLFRGTICVQCESQLIDTPSKQLGLCSEHSGRSSSR